MHRTCAKVFPISGSTFQIQVSDSRFEATEPGFHYLGSQFHMPVPVSKFQIPGWNSKHVKKIWFAWLFQSLPAGLSQIFPPCLTPRLQLESGNLNQLQKYGTWAPETGFCSLISAIRSLELRISNWNLKNGTRNWNFQPGIGNLEL